MVPPGRFRNLKKIEIKAHANLFITITEVNLPWQNLRDFAEYLIRVIFKLNEEPEKDDHRILTVKHTDCILGLEKHEYSLICTPVRSASKVDSSTVFVEVLYSHIRASVPRKFRKNYHPYMTHEQRNHRPILRDLISPTLVELAISAGTLPTFKPTSDPPPTIELPTQNTVILQGTYFKNIESAFKCLILSMKTLPVGTCNHEMLAQSPDELMRNLVFKNPVMFVSIDSVQSLLVLLYLKLEEYREAKNLPLDMDRTFELIHVCNINSNNTSEGIYIHAKLVDNKKEEDDEFFDLRWTNDNTNDGEVKELIFPRRWDPADIYANFVQVLMEVINTPPFPNWCNTQALKAVQNLVRYGLQQNLWPMLWWSCKSNSKIPQYKLLKGLVEEEGDTFIPDQDIKNILSATTPNNEASEVNDSAWTVYLIEPELVKAIKLKHAEDKTTVNDSSLHYRHCHA